MGPTLLYFGCRNKDKDYIYQVAVTDGSEELEFLEVNFFLFCEVWMSVYFVLTFCTQVYHIVFKQNKSNTFNFPFKIITSDCPFLHLSIYLYFLLMYLAFFFLTHSLLFSSLSLPVFFSLFLSYKPSFSLQDRIGKLEGGWTPRPARGIQ